MIVKPEIKIIQDAIYNSIWFRDIPEERLAQLVKLAKIKEYSTNSFLFFGGDITTDIYYLLSGRLRISVTSSVGQEFALTDLEAGEWIGEPALVDGKTRLLDVQVRELSQILIIPRGAVLQVGEEYPIMYKHMFFNHVKKTRGVYKLLAGLMFYPLHSRLAGRLLELADTHGIKTEQGVTLDVSLSQNDFAQLSMGSRQRINKIFGKWRELDIVVMHDDHYLIKNIEALEEQLLLVDED